MSDPESPFEVRGTLECGWSIFRRKGYSNRPQDVSVNVPYLEHLAAAGLNWLVVFWTNSPGFTDAWIEAVELAHGLGLNVARAVYGFSGGGPEYRMAEPDVPVHLLKPSSWGPDTALCPHDPETQAWMADVLASRLEPCVDGIDIEPARAIGRNCSCDQCRTLRPSEWDAFVVNQMTDRIHEIDPRVEVFLHVSLANADGAEMAQEFRALRDRVRHIFAWGADDEASLSRWLDADPRFEHFAKLGRALLFPDGRVPREPAEDRVARVFDWCRMAADRGKTGYLFDYRIFGGTEWQGHEDDEPYTRTGDRLPASVALMGAAMTDPYLDADGQTALIRKWRSETDWDLDDPERFYRG